MAQGEHECLCVLYGQQVVAGTYPQKVDRYSILRTIESLYGLHCLANACTANALNAAFAKPRA